jgi:hypothetical protein
MEQTGTYLMTDPAVNASSADSLDDIEPTDLSDLDLGAAVLYQASGYGTVDRPRNPNVPPPHPRARISIPNGLFIKKLKPGEPLPPLAHDPDAPWVFVLKKDQSPRMKAHRHKTQRYWMALDKKRKERAHAKRAAAKTS